MKSIVLTLVTAASLAVPTHAQEQPLPAPSSQVAQTRTPQPSQPSQERQPADERERVMPPPPPPAPPAPQERRPLPTRNVKVDVTISDQAGTAVPVKKVVSMLVADGRSGGVRSAANVPVAGGGGHTLPLNVDASVNVTPDQKVLLDLKFNYSSITFITPLGAKDRPAPTNEAERAVERDANTPRAVTVNVNEALTLLVTPGTPVVVARSADAAADRTVTVEVKAEILK